MAANSLTIGPDYGNLSALHFVQVLHASNQARANYKYTLKFALNCNTSF